MAESSQKPNITVKSSIIGKTSGGKINIKDSNAIGIQDSTKGHNEYLKQKMEIDVNIIGEASGDTKDITVENSVPIGIKIGEESEDKKIPK